MAAAAVIVGTAMMSGCRIDSHKDGDKENVKIATPFGGLQVKTNDSVVEGIGLPIYPGAELVKKKDKDSGAADVNLSFGSFQLRVKAASYRTTDGPDKLAAFYREALKRYGDVIQCSKDKPVGAPTRTAEGLTCNEDHDSHAKVNDDMSGKMELKAGSKQHQHIVAGRSLGWWRWICRGVFRRGVGEITSSRGLVERWVRALGSLCSPRKCGGSSPFDFAQGQNDDVELTTARTRTTARAKAKATAKAKARAKTKYRDLSTAAAKRAAFGRDDVC
jgi:hypothetical protein